MIKIEKIKTYKEIKNITLKGEKITLRPFIIYKIKSERLNQNRLYIGVLSSKKFGNAVARNYARRRIIAILNEIKNSVDANYIYVFIPRNFLIKKEYASILKEAKGALT